MRQADTTMHRIEVALDAGRTYEVRVGAGLLAKAGDWTGGCRKGRLAVVSEACVWDLHGAVLEKNLAAAGFEALPLLVPQGEAAKTFSVLEALCQRLLSAHILRSDVILGFGGGAVGDIAGLAAGLVRRGAGIIHLPTTLLAQIDSAIGGKTAINTVEGKNLIGMFHQPKAVIADTSLLETLPQRELLAGYGEMIKYGLIDDAAFFTHLEAKGGEILADGGQLRDAAIAHAVAAKARIVAEDEREEGKRALLNLGHSFAHALEAATGGEGFLLHGEAVAMGLHLAATLSERLELCPAEDVARIKAHLLSHGFALKPRWPNNEPPSLARFLGFMAQDKKATAEGMVLVLVHGIGQAFITPLPSQEALEAVLAEVLGLES